MRFIAYVDSLRSFLQRHCISLSAISAVENKFVGPPHRIEIRHRTNQDKDYYRILAAFKTVFLNYESPFDSDTRSKRQI